MDMLKGEMPPPPHPAPPIMSGDFIPETDVMRSSSASASPSASCACRRLARSSFSMRRMVRSSILARAFSNVVGWTCCSMVVFPVRIFDVVFFGLYCSLLLLLLMMTTALSSSASSASFFNCKDGDACSNSRFSIMISFSISSGGIGATIGNSAGGCGCDCGCGCDGALYNPFSIGNPIRINDLLALPWGVTTSPASCARKRRLVLSVPMED
mmetsp:Transcript_11319/g.24123  ORF Transcript_11319/g.24123 Transcript_11319/m.24123 type:complete len:212 (+) Transcript_11319:139-774(+)